MRIKRTKHSRNFTVLSNDLLQGRIIPGDAVTVFVYLISLPDGVRRDARSIAAALRGYGRTRVSTALKALEAARMYFHRRVCDLRTGQWRIETFLFEEPQPEGFTADDAAAAFAEPGKTDAPQVKATQAEATQAEATQVKAPAVETAQAESAQAPAPDGMAKLGDLVPGMLASVTARPPVAAPAPANAPIQDGTFGGVASAPLTVAGAWLQRVLTDEPRLALGAAELRELAPLAEPWTARRIPEGRARRLLTDGLPAAVHSARAIVADRLSRKLPAPELPDKQQPRLAECAHCRAPLPRTQRTGICAGCSGAAPAPTRQQKPAVPVEQRVAALRAAISRHSMPPGVTGSG